jgi:hypothetical protein
LRKETLLEQVEQGLAESDLRIGWQLVYLARLRGLGQNTIAAELVLWEMECLQAQWQQRRQILLDQLWMDRTA